MKKIDCVRWLLTIILLVFVWCGNMFAIKLCITLSALACEAFSYKLRKTK